MNKSIIISDEESDNQSIKFSQVRNASRGIVLNDKNEILIEKFLKYNLYTLPGGGIENDEEPSKSFKREVLEEAGLSCEIIKQLPDVVELRHKQDYKQINHCFLAKLCNKNVQNQNLDIHEEEDGLQISWYPLFEGIKILLSQVPETEQQKFLTLRDKIILQQAIGDLFNNSNLFIK
ncbi:hypothetical protein BG262_04645 [Floricoccus penangensis]|uniref:Nudix hydrolase domain-containing protein n=1 Tax=Floricoccus penangensis TaxID=1859475 RepID=A0A9Q5NZ69_9LACT|nr:NUDIX domain-containing protein [Floricoccus penangensis]OFI46309.1 hypothetical protein BG262_04645 [Floricoccus penangensis]